MTTKTGSKFIIERIEPGTVSPVLTISVRQDVLRRMTQADERIEALEAERDAALARVERLEAVLKKIASCKCDVWLAASCGKCRSCIANTALEKKS